jgi:tail protein P2 I
MTSVFDLLPAVHRVRDGDQQPDGFDELHSPLHDLLAVIDRELALVAADIDSLGEDWFIETCEDWVVPYLGDLVGVHGLGGARLGRRAQRALVANTIRYRRRKGTVAVLEQVASDVTGWTAKAVEFFQLLGWDQHLDHVRPDGGGTADLHDSDRAERTDGAFDAFAHTVDVRHLDNGRGRHNIPHVGLYLWRLQAYPLQRSTPAGVTERFSFDPLGRDVPLFNRPAAEQAIEHLAEERNVEGPLRRRPLHDELVAGVPASVDAEDGVDRFLNPSDPVFAVYLGGRFLRPDELSVCDLGDPGRRAVAPAVAAVDPVRGRLALQSGDPRVPEVSWAYGFSADLGGGPYDRRASVRPAMVAAQEALGDEPWWQMGVVRDAVGPDLASDLSTAVAAWQAVPRKPLALISVMDDRTYTQPIDLVIAGGQRLVIAAGDWLPRPDPTGGPPRRRAGDISASRTRPTIVADITIRGTPGPAGSAPGEVVLDGFLVDGSVTVQPGTLGSLRIAHTTLAPAGAPRLVVQAGGAESTRNVRLRVELDHAICGGIEVSPFTAGVAIRDSIVQGAISAPDVVLEHVTVLGTTTARTLHASESILFGPVEVARRQSGCVRFSWLPLASRVPRRHRCQPRDAASEATVRPTFTSTTLGDPGYAQLGRVTPREITQGAADEGEMGAYHLLAQSRRLADLEARLAEYTRLGLETGVTFVT